MCFSPHVSLTTAVIEFILAILILFLFRKVRISKLLAFIIFLLGFYQLTEFMLCISPHFNFWAKLGFVTYTLLPAVGLHCAMNCVNRKIKKALIYIPFVIFSAIAFFSKNFILGGSCNKIFVTVNSLLSQSFWFNLFYSIYYLTFIAIIFIALLLKVLREKNKAQVFYLFWLFAILLFVIPPVILFIIFPSLGLMSASVYCEFALLFSIVAFIAMCLNNKYHILD